MDTTGNDNWQSSNNCDVLELIVLTNDTTDLDPYFLLGCVSSQFTVMDKTLRLSAPGNYQLDVNGGK